MTSQILQANKGKYVQFFLNFKFLRSLCLIAASVYHINKRVTWVTCFPTIRAVVTLLNCTVWCMCVSQESLSCSFEGDVTLPRTKNKCPSGVVQVPYVIIKKGEVKKIRGKLGNCLNKYCVQAAYGLLSTARCYSGVGKSRGKQIISLTMFGCVSHGVIEHELNHMLGFFHEHTRSDREQHVKINWENILESSLFSDINGLLYCVCHKNAFSSNGKDAITPIPDASVQIGQRVELSAIDIMRINKLYNCSE
uniref:Metalloendopeptidase n=1 Tax=Scleropages formosus TaxID=113540 RepID=A0A8C9S5C9_SCLFO